MTPFDIFGHSKILSSWICLILLHCFCFLWGRISSIKNCLFTIYSIFPHLWLKDEHYYLVLLLCPRRIPIQKCGAGGHQSLCLGSGAHHLLRWRVCLKHPCLFTCALSSLGACLEMAGVDHCHSCRSELTEDGSCAARFDLMASVVRPQLSVWK